MEDKNFNYNIDWIFNLVRAGSHFYLQAIILYYYCFLRIHMISTITY